MPTNDGGPLSAAMIIMTAVTALTAALEAFQDNYPSKRVRGRRQFVPQPTSWWSASYVQRESPPASSAALDIAALADVLVFVSDLGQW